MKCGKEYIAAIVCVSVLGGMAEGAIQRYTGAVGRRPYQNTRQVNQL
jgi:hypothetical protein